jgi:hypothetical protein
VLESSLAGKWRGIDLAELGDEHRQTGVKLNNLIEMTRTNYEEMQFQITDLNEAIFLFGSVLSKAAKGDLSARIDLSKLPKQYGPIGVDINSMILATERQVEEIRKTQFEINQTLSICRDVVYQVAEYGDLSARIDTNLLTSKYKQIGEGINKIIETMACNIAELRENEAQNMQTIMGLSKILTKAAQGDLRARVDTKGWGKELSLVGESINTLIASLDYNSQELTDTLVLCNNIVDRVAEHNDLSARVNIDLLQSKHKQIGKGINKIIQIMQTNTEELRRRDAENMRTI